MATQIITVLCEGPHDVAFITKILKTIGFKSNENIKIGDYPEPINGLLISEVKKTNVGELNLQEVRQALLPSNTLQRGDDYLFLYSMGGDSKILSNSQPMLRKFISFIPKEEGGFDEALSKGGRLSMLFFLDADDKGISTRIIELNNEIHKNFNVKPFENHKTTVDFNGIKLGAFVFTGLDNNTGKLEDILMPLMEKDNEKIFGNAEIYLNEHFDDARLFPMKLREDEEGIIYEERSERQKDKLKYDELKSRIGIVGQLQKSGSNNVVCIGQTDYLTLEKIHTNAKCQEIIDFVEGFITA
jgi:hypothetical protein